jgi:hypothetical protein
MPDALTNSPRILNKLVPPFVGKSESGELSFHVQTQGWDVIDAQGSTSSMFRWRGFIDLGGLEREALTFFLQSAQVTESSPPSGLGNDISIVDCFSKVEISDDDLNHITTTGQLYTPGYLDSFQDMEQVLWARIRKTYHDAGWTLDNLQQTYWQQIWGEGIGTSGSRLHITRYIICASNESSLNIGGACFQCVGTAVEEPDLNYIMRLRRDYELAS